MLLLTKTRKQTWRNVKTIYSHKAKDGKKSGKKGNITSESTKQE